MKIPIARGGPRVLPVLVMVCSHSRFITATMIPSRTTGDLLAGMWQLIGGLGAVPTADLGQRDRHRTAELLRRRRIDVRPIDLVTADRAAMLVLPPVEPITGFRARVRLPWDYYVRIASNDYSVHPQAIGRYMDITADLTTVRTTVDGRMVGVHTRCWGTGQTITDPAHVQEARVLWDAFQIPHPPTQEQDGTLT
ncbi:Mu transposase domain-containing protein [Arthrobacter sp. CAN_A1]|uniref:Mu transposase domain-containing protein n=1 Tax=Arthrobacter sp. CAN_A1 TaxID=2787717 RepID=UPI0018C9EB3A